MARRSEKRIIRDKLGNLNDWIKICNHSKDRDQFFETFGVVVKIAEETLDRMKAYNQDYKGSNNG